MSASTKLSTAVKALCYMATEPERPMTSQEIAGHIGVNASKLRKLLSMLVKSKLIKSSQGSAGGFLLQKTPDDMHLQEIYCAVEDRKAFHLDVTNGQPADHSASIQINEYFLSLFADIQVDIENKMRKIKLQSVINQTIEI